MSDIEQWCRRCQRATRTVIVDGVERCAGCEDLLIRVAGRRAGQG